MDNLETICKKWSQAIKKYNFTSLKYRKQVFKTLQDIELNEQKIAVKFLDEFVFNNNDLLNEEIGKVDDKVASLEKTILAVRNSE